MRHFPLKTSVVLVSAVLSACQTVTTDTNPSHNTHHQLFDHSVTSPSLMAKKDATLALKNHFNQERFSVTTYRSFAMLQDKPVVDSDADSIWTSVLKTAEYVSNHEDEMPDYYLSASDYLDVPYVNESEATESKWDESDAYLAQLATDTSDLPYLRYDDEMIGKTDVDTVVRAVGMSEDYQLINDEIYEWADEMDVCVQAVHDELADLVQQTPSITSQNPQIKSLLGRIKNCQDTATAQSILKQANGYQRQDISHMNACLTGYQNAMSAIMHPRRQPKSLTGSSYDDFDAIHESYRTCTYVYYNATRLEPYHYADRKTQKELEMYAGVKACFMNEHLAHQALNKANKTHKTHASEHTDAFYEQVMCVDAALGEIDSEIKTSTPKKPTSLEDAQSRMKAQDEIAIAIERDIHYKPRKYQGFLGYFDAYKDMKRQDEDPENPSLSSLGVYGAMMSGYLDYMKKTKEQMLAKNIYQHNNTNITVLSHAAPQARTIKSLYAFDFESATAKQSFKIPVSLDFNQAMMAADVSAALPVMAVLTPRHTPLPEALPYGQVSFGLPKKLTDRLPTDVIHDAIMKGVSAGFDSISVQNFTPMLMTHDAFAKSLHANQVIKLSLGTKDVGRMYAIIAKSVVSDLKAYVDAHPERYPKRPANKDLPKHDIKKGDLTEDAIKKAIDDFATYNKGYKSSDVGGLFEIVQGILPIGFEQTTYLYLDKAGNLIGTQGVLSVDDDIQGTRTQLVGQTRLGQKVFDAHALAPTFTSSLHANQTKDGTTLLMDAIKEQRYKTQAGRLQATYAYDTSAYDYDDVTEGHAEDGASVGVLSEAQKTRQAYEEFEKPNR